MVSLRGRGLHRRDELSEDGFEVPAIFSHDIVLLPYMEVSLSLKEDAGRDSIVEALATRHLLAMVPSDGYQVGDIGTLALLDDAKASQDSVSLKGLWRIRIKEVTQDGARPRVKFKKAEGLKDGPGEAADLVRKVHGQVDEFVSLMPSVPSEVVSFVQGIDSPGKLADVCGGSPLFDNSEKMELLGLLDARRRLLRVSDRLERDLQTMRDLAKPVTIPDCDVCMDFADKAFEADDLVRGEIVSSFLQHVVEKHPGELMGLIAEKYGPSFVQKRSLR